MSEQYYNQIYFENIYIPANINFQLNTHFPQMKNLKILYRGHMM